MRFDLPSIGSVLALAVLFGAGCKPSVPRPVGALSTDVADTAATDADVEAVAGDAAVSPVDAPAQVDVAAEATSAADTAVDGPDVAVADIYDPNLGMPDGYAWKQVASMHVSRMHATAVWGNGYLYVFGGQSKLTCCKDPQTLPPFSDGLEVSLERYDPKSNSWELLPPPPVYPDLGTQVVWGDGKLYVYATYDLNKKFKGPTSVTQTPVIAAAFDPTTKVWTPLPTKNAPGKRWFTSMVWTGEELFVWGNFVFMPDAPGATFNPKTAAWTPLPSAPTVTTEVDSSNHALWSGDRVVFVTVNTGLEYLPASKQWVTFPQAPGKLVSPNDSEYRAFRFMAPIPGGFIGMTEKNSSTGPEDPYVRIWTHMNGSQTFKEIPVPSALAPTGNPILSYHSGIACWTHIVSYVPDGGACKNLATGPWLGLKKPQLLGRDAFAISPLPGGVIFMGGAAVAAQYPNVDLPQDGWLLQLPQDGKQP